MGLDVCTKCICMHIHTLSCSESFSIFLNLKKGYNMCKLFGFFFYLYTYMRAILVPKSLNLDFFFGFKKTFGFIVAQIYSASEVLSSTDDFRRIQRCRYLGCNFFEQLDCLRLFSSYVCFCFIHNEKSSGMKSGYTQAPLLLENTPSRNRYTVYIYILLRSFALLQSQPKRHLTNKQEKKHMLQYPTFCPLNGKVRENNFSLLNLSYSNLRLLP